MCRSHFFDGLTFTKCPAVTFHMGSGKLALLMGLLCLAASGQTFNTGTFLGTVTDASQAAVAQALPFIVRTVSPCNVRCSRARMEPF